MQKNEMTEIQLRKMESHKYCIVYSLGIDRTLLGTKYIEKMIIDKIEVDNLTERELEQIVEVWESRKIPSMQTKAYDYLDRFPQLKREENETQKNFLRRYVKLIQRCVQTFN